MLWKLHAISINDRNFTKNNVVKEVKIKSFIKFNPYESNNKGY